MVLVTGANGYIASRLVPRLVERGYAVRALIRRPASLIGRAWASEVDVHSGSTLDESSLTTAMQDVHTAYYLIHSMSGGAGYIEVERQSARRFAEAAEAAGVQHIIYLGGLADPHDPHLAPHMRSRIETGEILRRGRVPVTEFRAGVIAGAGSISFEMVRFLTECFPILPGPRWLRNLSQPIASENVIDYLVGGLERIAARGGIYEMGGPEQMPFGQVMLRYARCRGLERYLFTIPGIPIWWMALVVDRLTPVPRPIAAALIGGLQSDSRVQDTSALDLFPNINLLTFEQAVEAALAELGPEHLERVWEGHNGDLSNFRHEGFVVDYRTREINNAAEAVFDHLTVMGGPHQWPHARWLWKLRGWLDELIGGDGRSSPSRGMAHVNQGPGLHLGSDLDYYRVEALQPGRLLRLRSLLWAPGDAWLEWRVTPTSDSTARLSQTAFFAPRGLPGFLYWIALSPFHQFVLGGLINAIQQNSEPR